MRLRFAGSAANPVPYIDLPMVPTSATPGGPAFRLSINGAGFLSTSVVNWNGSPRATTFVSTTQLTAAIQSSDVATKGTASVTVVNPSPSGGASNVAFFQITAALPTVALGAGVDYTAASNSVQGDFNHDGILDLAADNSATNSVTVLLGNGDGTFRSVATYGTGKTPAGLVTGDFNQDGNLDLAIVNAFDNDVLVLLGNGDGTFAALGTFATGVDPLSVASGDFNEDGKLDLVVANRSDSTVSVLLGNGDGRFQPRVDLGVGSGPFSVTVGDFNNDGKLDLTVRFIAPGRRKNPGRRSRLSPPGLLFVQGIQDLGAHPP